MAALALLGRVLIEEDRLSLEVAVIFVAPGAWHILVQSLQWKFRAFIVVEKRRFPFRGVVAIHAGSDPILLELLAVDIVMATLALGRRGGEIRFDQLGLHVGRLMTINASRGPVRAHQRIGGFGMVEAREVLPVLGGVASFAANGRSVGGRLLHALGKLAFVRILVTALAVQDFPVIHHHRLGLGVGVLRLLVAVGAGDGNVAAG